MNTFTAGVAGLAVIAGAITLGTSQFAASNSSAFVRSCENSLNDAARWAVERAEERGRSVSIVARVFAGATIRSACTCGEKELGKTLSERQLEAAGAVMGIYVRDKMGRQFRRRSERRRDQARLAEDLRATLAKHNLSVSDVGPMWRKVDRVMKFCFRRRR